jgi:hypothetical protein
MNGWPWHRDVIVQTPTNCPTPTQLQLPVPFCVCACRPQMQPPASTCPGTLASSCAWIVSCSGNLQPQHSCPLQRLLLLWALLAHHLRQVQVLLGWALPAAPQPVEAWEGLLSRHPAL